MGVEFNAAVKIDVSDFPGWKPEQVDALFGGIAEVLAANHSSPMTTPVPLIDSTMAPRGPGSPETE